jgi:hypothetical protein
MTGKKWLSSSSLALCALLSGAALADEARTAAVFDTVFVNASPQATSLEENARVARMTAAIKAALEKSGQYRVVSIEKVLPDLDKVRDIHDCNGCEADLAKKDGAQVAVVAWAQKVSNLILNLNIRIVDAETGQTIKGGSVDIRGNDDRSWERGLKFLLEEHVFNGRG